MLTTIEERVSVFSLTRLRAPAVHTTHDITKHMAYTWTDGGYGLKKSYCVIDNLESPLMNKIYELARWR